MSTLGATKALIRDLADRARPHSEDRLARDADAYWRDGDQHWRSNSHWRDGDAYDTATWDAIGVSHLRMYEQMAFAVRGQHRPRSVVDWGCGGGANATVFAPVVGAYTGVDVSAASVAECERQVAAVCDTPFHGVTVDLAQPEEAVDQIPACDLFLCLYVLELVPSQSYGLRILRIARQLMTEDALAFIQVKYATDSWRTQPRRRYRRSTLGSHTTYRIEQFWEAATDCGLQPELVKVVPENPLDERYAYFLLGRA